MSKIARRENVWCKLSGMVTEANWERWQDAPYTRYLDFVLENFGADRVMVGSDWPVALCATDYATAMNVVIDWAGILSATERDAILGHNCQAFYRIDHI